MEQEYRHAIALMRYSAIAPLIPGLPEGYRNLADYLEKTSQKGLLRSGRGGQELCTQNTLQMVFQLPERGI